MSGASPSKPAALVVGSGFGCRIHVPALRAAGFEVVGLVGTDAARTERRARAKGVPQAFTDLDEAITRTGATLVTIATPPHTHAMLSMQALSRHCHVLCEKPFARDAAEARSMLAAAAGAGVIHLVGHEFRWKPERALVARAVAQGLIGEPRFATFLQYVSLVASPEARMPRWWFNPEAGGGWLGASGSHIVDQVRSTLGEFASLSAALPTLAAREGAAEDSYLVRFRLVNGIEGIVQQTGGAWGPFAAMTRIAGSKGTVWIDGESVKIADASGARDLPLPPDLTLPPPPPANDDPWYEYSIVELGPYTRLCEALRALIDGKPQSAVPVPTFADGLAEMEVLDAIRTSAASDGALVTLHKT